MNSLEENLFVRVDALFEHELKKRLHNAYHKVVDNISLESGSDKIENLKNKLIAMQITIDNLRSSLMKVGNNAITNFQNEIENVPIREKEKSIDHLKDLIIEEINELVKMAPEEFQR